MEDYPWIVPLEAEVMILLDTIQAAKMGGDKPSPISGRHDNLTIWCTDWLAETVCCRRIDYVSQIIQQADIGTAKLGIRRELGVASNCTYWWWISRASQREEK